MSTACIYLNRSMSYDYYQVLINKLDAAAQGDRNALLAAAFTGDVSIVEKLLDEGEDVDLQNKHGDSALHFASNGLQYHRELARDGVKLLPHSHHGSHKVVVRVLLRAQADPSLQNSRSQCVLHVASCHGQLPVMQALLPIMRERGASIDLQNNNGSCALHEVVVVTDECRGAAACDRAVGDDRSAHVSLRTFEKRLDLGAG